MSQEDNHAVTEVDILDRKTSKLESILNQARIGFYTLLGGTISAFGYGVGYNSEPSLEIGEKLLAPVLMWMGLYVAVVVNKKE